MDILAEKKPVFLISTILPGRDPAKAEGQPGVFFFLRKARGEITLGFFMFSWKMGFPLDLLDEHGQTLVALESLEFGVCVGWVFLTGAFNEQKMVDFSAMFDFRKVKILGTME